MPLFRFLCLAVLLLSGVSSYEMQLGIDRLQGMKSASLQGKHLALITIRDHVTAFRSQREPFLLY